MSNQTISSNLLRIRKDRGLSQEQLAEISGLSRGAYRNLEKGRAEPRTATLKSLASALDVPLKELFSPVRSLERVRFRSLKRLKSRDQVLAEVTRWLADFEDLEDLTGEKSAHGLKPLWSAINRKKTRNIMAIAARAREHFGLSEREPVHDICGLLESRGVKVYSICVANDAFMGLSVSEEDGGPAVIVNTWDRLPVETWIFSAAHELGHLLLHLNAYDVSQEEEDKIQEVEADEFASHFLMPEAVFRKEWEETAGLLLMDRVLKVKRVFRVSWRTVLYRVAQMMPEDQRFLVWQRFNHEYKLKKRRSLLKHDEPFGIDREIYQDSHGVRPVGIEPEGMQPHDFQEDRLSRLVRKAVEEDIISLSRASEILQMPLNQMRELSASWVAWAD
jgi:Zn-dependent peptidase ImmA (M78 family)/DNA-binding XRE family transcriptional regulator